jgi:hypothetical protein
MYYHDSQNNPLSSDPRPCLYFNLKLNGTGIFLREQIYVQKINGGSGTF